MSENPHISHIKERLRIEYMATEVKVPREALIGLIDDFTKLKERADADSRILDEKFYGKN